MFWQAFKRNLAVPGEIGVVSNRGNARFRNVLRRRHSQGQVHGDGQSFLWNDQIFIESVEELMELVVEEVFLRVTGIRDEMAALLRIE